MYAVKQSTSTRLPVALRNVSNGMPLLGVLYSAVTATVLKADGALATLTLSSSADWAEVTTGAFSGTGTYELVVPTSATSVVGRLVIAVTVVGALDSPVSVIDVVGGLTADVASDLAAVKAKTDNLPSDPADESLLEAAITAATSPLATSSALTTVGNNVTSLIGDVADVQTAVDSVAVDAETSRKVLVGRYKLDVDANTLTFYDEDGTTPLFVFDTFDAVGAAATDGVFERVPQ